VLYGEILTAGVVFQTIGILVAQRQADIVLDKAPLRAAEPCDIGKLRHLDSAIEIAAAAYN
jgi:hypothetical protein